MAGEERTAKENKIHDGSQRTGSGNKKQDAFRR